ncbi:MAG: DMT family transporter [Rhodospirillales bacterium]
MTAPAAVSPKTLGIVIIIAGLSMAAMTGALMKLLTDDMPPLLVAWVRFVSYFLIIAPFALRRVGMRAWRPPGARIQVLRGVLLTAGNILFIYGVTGLDYADAIAILYVYPFIMTLLAPMVLGERPGLVGWLGCAGGFAGVLAVARPDFGDIDTHAVLVFGAGCMVALQMLLNRKLGVISDPFVVSMWGALIPALALSFAAPFVWRPIGQEHLVIIAVMAVTTAASQTLMILAMSRAKASDLAPFTYTEIASAALIALVMFGTWPDAIASAGIGLIILSGVAVARVQGRIALRRQQKI